MADEQDDETTAAESAQADASETQAAAAEASETPAGGGEDAAPQPDAGSSEAGAEPAAAGPEGEGLAAAPADAEQAEAAAPETHAHAPVEQFTPKERRRRARSKHVGEPRPPRSPQERHSERLAERRVKAARRRARRSQERARAAARRTEGGGSAGTPEGARAGQPAAVQDAGEGKRKVRQGIVVSDKAEKTITVRIDVARRHRRYEKIVRSSSTLHAHDENNEAHEGDVVRVIESRPLSRSKRWRLIDVVERAQ